MSPHRRILLAAAAATLILSAPRPIRAQTPAQDWEGKTVSRIEYQGLFRADVANLMPIKERQPLTVEKLDRTYKELMKTQNFEDVKIEVLPDKEGQVAVLVKAREHPKVETVDFKGFNAIPLNQVRTELRIGSGDNLNPYLLKLDRDRIREMYLKKGYHFSEVTDEQHPGAGGILLTWTVTEGPLVSVGEITFTGNESFSASTLRAQMVSKQDDSLIGENGRHILFHIPVGREPFVERNLREDVEHIKYHYRANGWLDIHDGNHVFVRDVVFNEDKTKVTIAIHVDEGERYRIRSVRIEYAAAGPHLFEDEKILSWLDSRPGNFYTENDANHDAAFIRDKYGEKAYILAEVAPVTVFAMDSRELDLVFSIRENEKIYVGRLLFEGNVKTREEVLRREFTRSGFAPGEEFNNKNLNRALNRVRDRQWVKVPGGITPRTREGDDPQSRDVIVEVDEAPTGSIRFAAGYSSSFGILGMVDFMEKNFDLAKVPSGLASFGSSGFNGGGQILSLRLSPAARRQSYMVNFREPYFFGYDFGVGLRAWSTRTLRESYDEEQTGGSVTLDKRWDNFTAQISFNGYEERISNVDYFAPTLVKSLQGEYTVLSATPALIYDSRDSAMLPSEGLRTSLSHEYAGQVLPGDFDFHKTIFEAEGHVTLYTPERRTTNTSKHILSSRATLGHLREARRQEDIIIERFYAGGRDSIRGFGYRGMGPHEGGDPIGGKAYVLGTAEYSYPLFADFLRGAFFYDTANLTVRPDLLWQERWRNTVGFGIRFLIPQLGNIPVILDFGFPLTKHDEDERQTITFDVGRLF